MEFVDHFGDLHKVDPEFRKVWDMAQQIFDKDPIPDLVQQAREFRIVRCPMTVPVSNHPNAQHQSHIAGPHSDDQIVAEREDCERHILEAKQQIFPQASAIDRESPDLVAACKHILEDALAYSTIAHRKRFFTFMVQIRSVTKWHRNALRSLIDPRK